MLRGYFAAYPKNFCFSPYGDRREFRHDQREEYLAEIPGEFLGSAFIFLDPDNGLEVKSSRPGNFAKYVRYEEVAKLYGRMDSDSVLSVYQHLPRVKRERLFERLNGKLVEVCGCTSPVFVTEGSLAFILIAKDVESRERVQRVMEEYRERRPKIVVQG